MMPNRKRDAAITSNHPYMPWIVLVCTDECAELIAKIPGVDSMTPELNGPLRNEYSVWISPLYDKAEVVKEIEALCQCESIPQAFQETEVAHEPNR